MRAERKKARVRPQAQRQHQTPLYRQPAGTSSLSRRILPTIVFSPLGNNFKKRLDRKEL